MLSEGDIYVISGPAFIGNVLVPNHLWTVLYSPAQRRAGAYLITNDETRIYSTVTGSVLENMFRISLLPRVSQKVRDSGMELPKPTAQRGGGRGNTHKSELAKDFTLQNLPRIIIEAIKRAERN